MGDWVLISVGGPTDPPYCTGSAERHLVLPTNTSVTLTCRVEAVPQDLKFTWKVGSPVLRHGQGKVPPPPRHSGHLASSRILGDPGGHQTSQHQPQDLSDTGILPAPGIQPSPALQAAAPAQEQQDSPWKDSWEILQSERQEEVELEGQQDPRRLDQSTLTITPTASTLVGCYARNSVGHIRVPCTYSLTVVGQYTATPSTTPSSVHPGLYT